MGYLLIKCVIRERESFIISDHLSEHSRYFMHTQQGEHVLKFIQINVHIALLLEGHSKHLTES